MNTKNIVSITKKKRKERERKKCILKKHQKNYQDFFKWAIKFLILIKELEEYIIRVLFCTIKFNKTCQYSYDIFLVNSIYVWFRLLEYFAYHNWVTSILVQKLGALLYVIW